MKKFISFVMAAAMVASLVPATAFAATGDVTATAKIIDAWNKTQDTMEDLGGVVDGNVPELQLKVTSADYQQTSGSDYEAEVTITLDNAEFASDFSEDDIEVTRDGSTAIQQYGYEYTEVTADSIKDDILSDIYDGKTISLDDYVVVDTAETVADQKESDDSILQAIEAALNSITGPTESQSADAVRETWWQSNAYTAFGVTYSDYTWGYYTDGTGKHEGYVYTGSSSGAEPYFTLEELEEAYGGSFEAVLEDESTWKSNSDTAYSNAFANNLNGNILATEEYVVTNAGTAVLDVTMKSLDDDELVLTISGRLAEDDVISIDLRTVMDKTSKNATVSVDSKMVTADDLVYVNVTDAGFTASVKKTVSIAEEEVAYLNSNGLKLEETVAGSFQAGDEVTLKLSKGFEFVSTDVYVNGIQTADEEFDDNELTFTLTQAMLDEDVDSDGIATLTIKSTADSASTDRGLKVEATSASADTVGTITVTVGSLDKVTVDVIEAVDYEVVMSVDEDEDVPVIYSGVDADNTGITDDSDHETLEITLEESFPGAWSSRQGFTITIPEGVYVTDVEIVDQENFWQNDTAMTDADWEDAFEEAYQDGDHLNFEFAKRVFDDVNADLNDDPASLTFILTLVADPGFEGDVEIGFEGSLVESQSVVAATFVSPYTVTAEQNDLKIDARYTEIPTDIVVTEAADGLWEKGAEFTFQIEKELISFEDDATFTADEDSDMELKTTQSGGTLTFEVKSTSDEATAVTISDMELYMDRNIPTGAYALELYTTMSDAYEAQLLYAYDDTDAATADYGDDLDGDNFVGDITDYSNVVKDSFINVITGTTDGAMFTTKVVVPVGENYLISGDTQIELDVPAYINADGYTMLPVRAVSTALGIDNNSVLWDQDSKTVTILYGQRIISMTYGQKVMYVNGQAIATSSAVEITNDRAFLPMRDLATALGITDITWDDTTKTATLNGGEA